MFSKFSTHFQNETQTNKGEVTHFDKIKADYIKGFKRFFAIYAGASFNGGLYRIHHTSNVLHWGNIVSEAYPSYRNRIICFGYDWLGRQFALSMNKQEKKEPTILMFEVGTGQILEIPETFLSFHNEELVNYTEEALALSFFSRWMDVSKKTIPHDVCIGYKIPLFLGGEDTIQNLEPINMDVYWSICGQILNKTRTLPLGTKIHDYSIADL